MAIRREFLKAVAAGATLRTSAAAAPPPSGPFFSIADYNAVADGKTLTTAAIQAAVDACAKSGGGTVIIPAGRYLTGPIFLKSNVRVEIESGATLVGSTDFNHYPAFQGRWEGLDRTIHASMFTGADLENVSITGRGTLDGQGRPWWDAQRQTREMRRKLNMDDREGENPPGASLKWARPRMINLYRCKNVLLQGITITNSPSWNVHPVLCQNVVIDGLTIFNPENSPNTDGIDPDSCKNVRISNCYLSCGDDCIIIKSGYKPVPGQPGVPSEQITVTNCVFGTGHCGVGIGSETAGGVRDVTVSNCICDGTRVGLRLKTARGRGNVVENFRATNFVMRNVQDAISVTMFYAGGDKKTPQPVSEITPTFRNFHFSFITVAGARRVATVEGLPERPVENVTISDVSADGAVAGIACLNARDVVLEKLNINAIKGQAIVSMENVADALVASCTAREGTGTYLELHGAAVKEVVLSGNRLSRAAKAVGFTEGASEQAISR